MRIAQVLFGLVGSIAGVGVTTVAERAVQQGVDGGGYQFDVSEFFRGNVRDQVVVGLEFGFAPEVERLVHVVHQGGHFAETSAEQFLYGGCGVGIGRLGLGQLDLELINSYKHNG